MLRVEEALKLVEEAAGAPRRKTERVPIASALGRVLGQDVAIDHAVPPFDRATMDGFAVRASDVTADAALAVLGRAMAGGEPARAVGKGEAVAVMTGAPLPAGTDAVVPVERSRPVEGARGAETRVRLAGSVHAGENVAKKAEQVAAGAVVAREGEWIHAALVGVLAAAGVTEVTVVERPRVFVVCTGDELVPASKRPGAAQIRDSNGHALVAQAQKAGALASYDGPVRDDRDALRAAVERGLASGCDVLCVSGGVSMGDKDHVPGVLDACGVERRFHRWAVKPGGPLWFGRKGDTLVFGLPGNPVATFVGFELAVVPVLRMRMGFPFAARTTIPALAVEPLPAPTDRRQFIPVKLGFLGTRAAVVAKPVPWKGSGDLFGLAAASGLAIVPETTPAPDDGHDVPATAPAPAGPGGAGRASDAPPTVEVVPLGTFLGRLPS